MAWTLEFTDISIRQLKKLDKHISGKIRDYLKEKIKTGNPKSFAKPLIHNKSGLWRFRMEKYRIICEIKDKELVVLVLQVDHRKKVYE